MVREVDPRLRFLVGLTRMRLPDLTPSAWTQLREDFDAFIYGRSFRRYKGTPADTLGGSTPPETADERWTPDVVAKIQPQVHRILDKSVGQRIRRDRNGVDRVLTYRLRDGKPDYSGPKVYVSTIESTTMFQWDVTVGVGAFGINGRPPALSVSGDPFNVVLALTQLVLWTQADTPIRMCDECEGFFVASRSDSTCCSPECTKRKWWKGPKGKKTLRRIYKAQGWTLGARIKKNSVRRDG